MLIMIGFSSGYIYSDYDRRQHFHKEKRELKTCELVSKGDCVMTFVPVKER